MPHQAFRICTCAPRIPAIFTPLSCAVVAADLIENLTVLSVVRSRSVHTSYPAEWSRCISATTVTAWSVMHTHILLFFTVSFWVFPWFFHGLLKVSNETVVICGAVFRKIDSDSTESVSALKTALAAAVAAGIITITADDTSDGSSSLD